MTRPIIGSKAIASGALSRGALRWNYTALHPDVYVRKDQPKDLSVYAAAAWLWTGRRGIVAGRAAAYLHGVTWIDDTVPVELIARHRRARSGVVIRQERIAADEVTAIARLPVTSPARTALDLSRHLPRDEAVAHIDALAAVTGVTARQVAVLVERYRGARGIPAAREATALMDGGAQSPQESRLRLQLIDAGLPKPCTNIVVADELWEAAIPMGWPGPKVGVALADDEASDPYLAAQTAATRELFQRQGWILVCALPGHTGSSVIGRVRAALRVGSGR
ncbi:hypothetical protein [Mycolicibacterium sp. XJ1819]